MARVPSEREEAEFIQGIGLDPNDLAHLVAQAPAAPADLQARIAQRAQAKIAGTAQPTRRAPRWRWLASSAALVAAVLGLVLLVPGLGADRLALAMEQAIANLQSYHATVEVQWLDGNGTPYSVEQAELWVQGATYACTYGTQQEFYANGEQAWSIDHRSREVWLRPDLEGGQVKDRLALDELARWLLRHPYQVVGSEQVAGRAANKLAVTTPEGLTQTVWIDKENHLPLQIEEWWGQNRIRLVRYSSLEINPAISPDRFALQVPAGYTLNESAIRWVADLTEAANHSGLALPTLAQAPQRIAAAPNYIALQYPSALVELRKPIGSTHQYADAIGQADGQPMGINRSGESLNWTQSNLWISISGREPEQNLATARLLASQVSLPDPSADLLAQAANQVTLDAATAKALQAESDRRGGPGIERQNPVEAAYTFLVEQLGDAPVPHEPLGETSLRLTAHTGLQAIVEVPAGPYARLYLKRLAPHSHGVWVVAGYDPH